MSLGCSHTEGVGVNNDETWPAQFCGHIENGVNLNFGLLSLLTKALPGIFVQYVAPVVPGFRILVVVEFLQHLSKDTT